jgi:hypothetical protein
MTGTESWTLTNLLGGIVLAAVVVALVSYAMTRATRD